MHWFEVLAYLGKGQNHPKKEHSKIILFSMLPY